VKIPYNELLLDNINRASGMELEELSAICGLVKMKQPKTILEIGTKHGRTAINMANVAPADCHITCVDIEHLDHTAIAGYLAFRKLQFITGDSLKFDFKTLKTKFDFILVDGCHMAEWVKNDTKKAYQVLAPRGVIVWHDYGKPASYTTIQVKETLDAMKIFPTVIPGTSLAYKIVG